MDLLVIFITGLTVGGLTCLAVQGGLLASVIAAREEESTRNKKAHAFYATGIFLSSKLVAYTLLGFFLGAFGGAINISDTVQSVMQLLAGVYMIIVALNLLNIHPIFRYAIIQPPRFLTRIVRNQSRSKDIFSPALLGAMTIFIPCGTTLAMETLAISSANAFTGAAVMGTFILGTIPLFFGIGVVTSVLGDMYKTRFLKLAAIALVYLGLTSINGAFIVLGFPLNSHIFTQNTEQPVQKIEKRLYSETPKQQNITIRITSEGYSPNYIKVKKGQPVTLTLNSKDAFSCALAFRIPEYGISKNLHPTETQTVTFTPQKTGKIPFACSMGMYTGVIEVI